MVNTVRQEMNHEEERVVGEVIIDVKEESVKAVFEYSPDHVPHEEADSGFDEG